MSDTPRTDEFRDRLNSIGSPLCHAEFFHFARELEQELNDAKQDALNCRQIIDTYSRQKDDLRQAIVDRDAVLKVAEGLANALQFVKDYQKENCDGQIGWRSASAAHAICGDVLVKHVLEAENAIAEFNKLKKGEVIKL